MEQNQKTVTLEVTVDEVNAILAGLQEVAAKISNPLSKKIVDQAQEQILAVTE